MSWRRTVAGHCNWKSLEITTNQHVLFSLEIPMGSRGPWCLKYIPTHSKAPKPQSVQSWQMRKCKWEIVMEVLEGVPGFLKHQNSDHFGRIRQITHLFCPTAWLASVISGVSFPKCNRKNHHRLYCRRRLPREVGKWLHFRIIDWFHLSMSQWDVTWMA